MVISLITYQVLIATNLIMQVLDNFCVEIDATASTACSWIIEAHWLTETLVKNLPMPF